MKTGTYLTIPERPADVEQLWRRGASIDVASRPSWMKASDVNFFRRAYSVRAEYIPRDSEPHYRAEIGTAEAAGLIVDRSASHGLHDVYVSRQSDYGLFSIGIHAGWSPCDLTDHPGVANPVLSRDDVSDVQAVMVADPFMIWRAPVWHMFFEVLNWRANKGEIGLATSHDGLSWKYEGIVLSERFHLSYPHVFQWAGDFYMVPESRQDHSVRLYKAVDFPSRWTHVATLLEGHDTADSSLFRFNDRWWMFTSPASDTLTLYSADDLTGVWQPHPANPIVQGDATCARPAGRVLVDGTRITRFAQNCQPSYGSAVVAFDIERLTATEYSEHRHAHHPILRGSGSGWNALGMHHADVHQMADREWLACVDGWTTQFEGR